MTENDIAPDTINAHYNELSGHYNGLSLSEEQPGLWVVSGDLTFCANYGGVELADTFSIRVALPDSYPMSPPTVSETGGRIPREIDYHVFPSGSFCLGARIEVKKKFAQNPNLLHFVNNQVVPFLYAYVYKLWFGEMPWGELSHGKLGVLEYYNDLFQVSDFQPTLSLLDTLRYRTFSRDRICPCGSRRKLRKCHGPQLKELVPYCTPDEARTDRYLILEFLALGKDRLGMNYLKLP